MLEEKNFFLLIIEKNQIFTTVERSNIWKINVKKKKNRFVFV